MATITMDSSSVSNSSKAGSGGNGSQIAAITKQISQLTQKLKELGADTTIGAKEKKEMQDIIRAQIQMLQAQLAQIQQQQAQKAADKNGAGVEDVSKGSPTPRVAEGVNNPTEDNAIDVYV
ncbi:FlxA-like family protein [Pectobacterium brasiliense]|uniref:FlxA-like family protein n=1 Tax=Pectobacterium brasiliense TaxID=180957 RepID=UPI001969367D|nr:FlxA-like family protein [Pectobacterium brasiliense]MBN3264139.1 FlxA-like family protein [Pectobacterium brasiliense]